MLSNHGVSDCQINNVHKRNRLDWCNARVNWNHNQRRQVFFFTDESTFGIQRKRGSMWVYRRPGERYSAFCIVERNRQRGAKLMVLEKQPYTLFKETWSPCTALSERKSWHNIHARQRHSPRSKIDNCPPQQPQCSHTAMTIKKSRLQSYWAPLGCFGSGY